MIYPQGVLDASMKDEGKEHSAVVTVAAWASVADARIEGNLSLATLIFSNFEGLRASNLKGFFCHGPELRPGFGRQRS